MSKTKELHDEVSKNKMELLKDEYFHLQGEIENYDGKTLTFKGWSVTVSLAALVAAFVQKIPVLFVIGSSSSLLFWLMEFYWKMFQSSFYGRVMEIENAFNNKEKYEKISPLQISTSWRENYKKKVRSSKEIKDELFKYGLVGKGHIFNPHLFIIVAGIVLFILRHKVIIA